MEVEQWKDNTAHEIYVTVRGKVWEAIQDLYAIHGGILSYNDDYELPVIEIESRVKREIRKLNPELYNDYYGHNISLNRIKVHWTSRIHNQ